MKSREGIPYRTVVIVGIVIMLLAICFHFYMQHNVRAFEASLPKVPVVQPVDTLGSGVSFAEEITSESGITIAEEPRVEISESHEQRDPKPEAENAGDGCGTGECNHGDSHHSSSAVEKVPGYDIELTQEAYDRLISEILTLPRPHNLDELLDTYEAFLLTKFGPDPEIPKLTSKIKTMFTVVELAVEVETTGHKSNEVGELLSQLPAVVVGDITEIAINLFNPSEEEAAVARWKVSKITERIDTLKLLQETRPMVQAGIEAGDISPEEGEAFMQSMTGLNVAMSKEDRTSTVKDSAQPLKVPAPQTLGTSVSEFPEN